ncbi:MAG TPA: hypothetical protein VGA72_11840 [Anaerolineales bacterium]
MKNRWNLTIFFLLIIVSALSYLPLIGRFGYYYDDWYLMYSAGAYGPGVFWDIFSIDRPLRVLVMIPAYLFFGGDPLFYNLSAYVLRVIGALALLWCLTMLWPGRRWAMTLMSLLFLIYPGFLSQPNAIDYQSHIVSFAAALFSIALTLKAILSENRIAKVIFHLTSVLLGWFYLSQIEWYISLEFFRWACIFLLSSRQGGTLYQKAVRAIQCGYPTILVPMVFLVWRFFFFTSERGATDVGMQFEQFKLYPIQTIYRWGLQVLQDLFDVVLSAWTIPLSQLTGYIQRWGGALAVSSTVLILVVLHKLKDSDSQDGSSQFDLTREALLLGLLTAIAGLVPIAMVNREVAFPSFSRYALVSSVGVAIFIVAVLININGRILRNSIAAGFVFIAMLTHHANSVKSTQETALVQNFWWQVSWRVPQFEHRTTLIASYPSGAVEEDYFVWGPANLIYYPEKQNNENIQPGLYASVLNKDAVVKVLTMERQKYDNRRNIITYPNYRNILILTQPTSNSCVHVIDGSQPEYSRDERDTIRVVGPYSEIEHVLTGETPHTPPTVVFGPEPLHGWCYFYEKADLARQSGDWKEVLALGNEALDQGFAPQDPVEWIPFLQAYAVAGDIEHLTEVASVIAMEPYISQQVCQRIGSMQGLANPVIEVVDSLYCLE